MYYEDVMWLRKEKPENIDKNIDKLMALSLLQGNEPPKPLENIWVLSLLNRRYR